MSEKNNNQANTEATTTDLQAKLDALKAEFNEAAKATGKTGGYSEEDNELYKAIAFKGTGAENHYYVLYNDQVVSKVERVKGTTFKGELTEKQGLRKAVALAEVKHLQEAGLV